MSKLTYQQHKKTAQADNLYGQYIDTLNGVPGRSLTGLFQNAIEQTVALPSEPSVSKQVHNLFMEECSAWSRAKKRL